MVGFVWGATIGLDHRTKRGQPSEKEGGMRLVSVAFVEADSGRKQAL